MLTFRPVLRVCQGNNDPPRSSAATKPRRDQGESIGGPMPQSALMLGCPNPYAQGALVIQNSLLILPQTEG